MSSIRPILKTSDVKKQCIKAWCNKFVAVGKPLGFLLIFVNCKSKNLLMIKWKGASKSGVRQTGKVTHSMCYVQEELYWQATFWWNNWEFLPQIAKDVNWNSSLGPLIARQLFLVVSLLLSLDTAGSKLVASMHNMTMQWPLTSHTARYSIDCDIRTNLLRVSRGFCFIAQRKVRSYLRNDKIVVQIANKYTVIRAELIKHTFIIGSL